MSNKNERDTHFAGFARLLADEIQSKVAIISPFGTSDDLHTLIAQRAYDLVEHALKTCSLEAFEITGDYWYDIPDLTAWPPNVTKAE